MPFEVIGEDGMVYEFDDEDDFDDDEDEIEGIDVMGYGGPMSGFEGSAIVGYDDYGSPIIVGKKGRKRRGRGRRRRHGRKRRHNISVARPGWRGGQLASGVQAPDQGMLTLPMSGRQGNTFTDTITQIIFEGQVQKPFRPERLLVSVVRTGATAVGRLTALIFNGTDLQQLDINPIDIEQLGDSQAFGVRLTTTPVEPGVFVRLVTTLTSPLTSPDTIQATIQFLGRAVH